MAELEIAEALQSASTYDLDLKIIKELCSPAFMLQREGRETYASLGRRLGVDEETIRTRLNRCVQSGLLKGWQLLLDPGLLGLKVAQVSADAKKSDARSGLVKRLASLDGTVFVFGFLDGIVSVVFFYRDDSDLTEKSKRIASACGANDWVLMKRTHYFRSMKLGRTDWRILRALRANPRQNMTVLARRLDLSTRTVKRRLNVLIENNAFYILPVIDIKSFKGLNCGFFVHCQDLDMKRKLDALLFSRLRRVSYVNTGFDGYSVVSVVCQSISEAERISKWLERVEGVQEVTMRVTKEMVQAHGWFDRVIEEHLVST